MRRRQFIKSAAAGGIAMSASGIPSFQASANNTGDVKEFVEDMKKAEEKRAEEGVEAKNEFLDDKGYDYNLKQAKVSLTDDRISSRKDDDDKIEVQIVDESNKIAPNDIKDPKDGGILFDVSGVKDKFGDNYYFSMGVTHHFEAKYRNQFNDDEGPCGWVKYGDYGEPPFDGAGMFFKHQENYWELARDNPEEDTITGGSYVDYKSSESDPIEGTMGFAYRDAESYDDWLDELREEGDSPCYRDEGVRGTWRDAGTVGVVVQPKGDHSPEDRSIFSRYTHTYYDYSLSPNPSLSIGLPPSVSVTAARASVNNVEINTDEDGYLLKMTQDEFNEGP